MARALGFDSFATVRATDYPDILAKVRDAVSGWPEWEAVLADSYTLENLCGVTTSMDVDISNTFNPLQTNPVEDYTYEAIQNVQLRRAVQLCSTVVAGHLRRSNLA